MRNDHQVRHPTQQSASQGGAKTETWACVNGAPYRVRSRPLPVPSSDSLSSSPKADPRTEPDEYKVGYGKPPKDTQFPKGQSGNPKGRPKGSKNLVTLIHEMLDQLIPVREDGRSRKVPARAAIAKRMVNGGLAGNQRAIDQLLKIPGVLGTGDGMAFVSDSNREPPTAGDRAILERFKQRVIEEHKLSADAVGTDKADDEGGSV
jgi:Family of unknown function (DUF5681)